MIKIQYSTSTGGEGAEVIYALRNSDALAKNILESISNEGQIARKYYQRRLPNDPSKDYYFIQRLTGITQPVLIEYGFIDNSNDLKKIENNLLTYGEAVVRAVAEYTGTPYVTPEGVESNVYVVKKGDTLYDIASKYGVTVSELKVANKLSSNLLSIGQSLIIPTIEPKPLEPSEYVVYKVRKGDSLYSIAREFDTTVNELIEFNQLATTSLDIDQQLLIPIKTEQAVITNYYVVKQGDSLYSIAKKYGTTIDEIIKQNNLETTILQLGDQLIIPNYTNIEDIEEKEENENIITYVVKSGDSLYSIAKKYNTTVNELKMLNNLNTNLLSIGQELLIPSTENYATYYVKPGDNLYNIANKYRVTVDEIKKFNNLNSELLSIGQVLLIPA